MSDIFTLKTIPLNPELGMALKNFRVEKKVTAKSITEKFDKASSYVSKLENGAIKKIDTDFLIQLCNFIDKSEQGLLSFFKKITLNYTNFSNETKIIIKNIDELVIEHQIHPDFITYLNDYLKSHDLTIAQLTDKINENEDIIDVKGYENLPKNIWYTCTSDIRDLIIKLEIPLYYIENLLKGNYATIHFVIAEAILYSLYKLGAEEKINRAISNTLNLYNIKPTRMSIIPLSEEGKAQSDLYSGLDIDTINDLNNINSALRVVAAITKNYGAKKVNQISKNMSSDMGFYFAYMSLEIDKLGEKDKDKKQQFLQEVKALVEKYSQNDSGIDLYDL
jgi:transcriptional regulator with XRE-family HTH domain